MEISEFFEDKKPNHSKAKDKKPKKIKPNICLLYTSDAADE